MTLTPVSDLRIVKHGEANGDHCGKLVDRPIDLHRGSAIFLLGERA